MVVRFFATKVVPTVAVASAAVTVYCGSAQGFFPPVPNGSDQVVTPPSVSPISPLPPPVVPPTVPPVVPPPFVPPPPVVPPTVPPPPIDPEDCDPPQQVPEPASIMAGLIGLSVLGAGAWKKKQAGKSPVEQEK